MIFAGQKVTLTIQVDHQSQVESASSLIVVVNFSADPPTFETSELKNMFNLWSINYECYSI